MYLTNLHGLALFAIASIGAQHFTGVRGFAQEETDVRIARLHSGTADELVKAIRSIDIASLNRGDAVGQLILLLDDERTVETDQTPFGLTTVQETTASKLLALQESLVVGTILSRVPQLKLPRARGLAFEAVTRIGKTDRKAYARVLPYCTAVDVYERSRAISALSAVGDSSTETIEQFGEFLNDSHPVVRGTALDALEKRLDRIGPLIPAISRLLDDDSDVYVAISSCILVPHKLRARAARLLGKIGPNARIALPKLRILMNPEYDNDVRIWSAAAVAAIKDAPPPAALELLGVLLLLDADNEYVQNDAAAAITELGKRAAPLLDELERAKRHASPAVRSDVARALFAVDPETALGRVLPMVDDEDSWVSATAVEAISGRDYKGPKVIEAYVRALNTQSRLLDEPAASAVNALAKLGAAARPAIPALEQLVDKRDISDALRDQVTQAIEDIRAAGTQSDESR